MTESHQEVTILAVKFFAFWKLRPKVEGTNTLLVLQPKSWGPVSPRPHGCCAYEDARLYGSDTHVTIIDCATACNTADCWIQPARLLWTCSCRLRWLESSVWAWLVAYGVTTHNGLVTRTHELYSAWSTVDVVRELRCATTNVVFDDIFWLRRLRYRFQFWQEFTYCPLT